MPRDEGASSPAVRAATVSFGSSVKEPLMHFPPQLSFEMALLLALTSAKRACELTALWMNLKSLAAWR